jgi:hypothetical protein
MESVGQLLAHIPSLPTEERRKPIGEEALREIQVGRSCALPPPFSRCSLSPFAARRPTLAATISTPDRRVAAMAICRP